MIEEHRERGFIVLHRRLRSSRLYRSLTAEQRSVFNEILLSCNWKPSRMMYARKWVEIGRGEYADSLERIAELAAVSVKVVRTTYAKLLADDREAGGNGPFLVGRWSGTKEGTGLRILRVVRYDEFQRIDSDEGTASGRASGTAGARQGQASGTAGAASEPREPGEPGKPGGAGGIDDVWSDVIRSVQRRVRADTFQRFFAPLTARRVGTVLVVEAPERFHRDYVADNYGDFLAEVLSALNHQLQLEFVVAAGRAAGGA